MKVLLINSDSGSGSTGRIVNDICLSLREKGDDCLLGFGREDTGENKSAVRIGNKFDVYFHVQKTRLFDSQGLGSYHATKKFLKAAEAFSPDIIHLHNIHGSYIHYPLLFDWLNKIGKPVIWTLHDCWTFTGHCTNYSYVSCEKWKTGCFKCLQKKIYPASLLFDRSSRNYKMKKELFGSIPNLTITTVSNWLCRQAEQSFFYEHKIRVLPNGIDLSAFHLVKSDFRERFHLENKTILLGVASVWNDRKGLWLFRELADRLDSSYQLVLVGVTRKQKKTLPDRILCIERTENQHELVEIYTASDLFLNPSVEETFGMVSLEAMACGTPVISNRLTANPELITEKCGVTVDQVTTDCFMKAVDRMQKEPKHFSDCIARARQFDKNKMTNEYLSLYQNIIEGSV